jgi:hypothetical protein
MREGDISSTRGCQSFCALARPSAGSLPRACIHEQNLNFYGFLINVRWYQEGGPLCTRFFCPSAGPEAGLLTLMKIITYVVIWYYFDISIRFGKVMRNAVGSMRWRWVFYRFLITRYTLWLLVLFCAQLEGWCMICSFFRFFSKIWQCLWKFLWIFMYF